jgi:pyruvate dehydrogenase E2 component (dihydrolipoamide acetyltransferase)
MADIVEMIQLSPTMEEGKLVAWLKNEGDRVSTGDLIAEIETDKATMEMESFFDGTLLKILAPAGTSAKVGTHLAIIGEPGEDIAALLAGGAPKAAAAAPAAGAPAAAAADTGAGAAAETAPAADGERVRSSPVARKLAAEHGVDLRGLTGSGPAGRVVLRDVEAAVAAGPARPAAPAPAAAARPLPAPAPVAVTAADTRVELSPMRKAIARNLTAAWQAPSFTLTRSVAVDALMKMRADLNAQLAAGGQGVKVSVNDLVTRAVALALHQEPGMNVAYDGDHLVKYGSVDIGMAVAVEGGLVTPVLRAAHTKSVVAIAAEARELATKARDRKLKPDDYVGSTFSISNLGMFGIDHFTAVLNPPAAGILAVGAVTKQPVVRADGSLGVGERMNVTLTADHRAVDGAVGAVWLQKLVALLENPLLLLV